MEPIMLRDKKDLDIYINPQRQRLLRIMYSPSLFLTEMTGCGMP